MAGVGVRGRDAGHHLVSLVKHDHGKIGLPQLGSIDIPLENLVMQLVELSRKLPRKRSGIVVKELTGEPVEGQLVRVIQVFHLQALPEILIGNGQVVLPRHVPRVEKAEERLRRLLLNRKRRK
jgi:hypothetical protein